MARAIPTGQPGNLLVTHVVLSLDIGGLERVVVDLIREGPELGIASTVVCIEKRGELANVAEATGARVVCLNKPPGLSFRTRCELRSLFRELAPDIIHTHQIGALFYSGPAARRAGVPVVVHTEHGKHYGKGLRRRILGKLAARSADKFFCVSQDIADAVKRYRIAPAAKVDVLRNGIRTSIYRRSEGTDELRKSLGIPVGAPVVGTVGRLSEVKRQDILLESFALLRTTLPNAHLLLVGDGPFRDTLQQHAERLGISPAVHFLGYQSAPQRFLHLMDIFAITSRSEGMPLSVLEAWAAGVPVIASRVGGLPEMIDHDRTGILVPFGEPEALARAFCRALADPEFRRAVRETARADVLATYDVRNMARAYFEQYRALLARREPSRYRAAEPV